MKTRSKKFRPLRLLSVSVIVVLLAACASSTDDYFVEIDDGKAWARKTLLPIIDSEPDKALALINQRLRDKCRIGQIELGTGSFASQLDGWADLHIACQNLTLLGTYAHYKQGSLASNSSYVMQLFHDFIGPPWVKRTRPSLKSYGLIDCNTFDRNRVALPGALGRESSDADRALYGDRFELPAWYDLHAIVQPKAAEKGVYLFKHHLCRLDLEYDQTKVELRKANFIADVTRIFGLEAANDVRRYIDQVYTPFRKVYFEIMTDYGIDQTEKLSKYVVLYENALQHVRALGLDRVIYDTSPVFESHLQGAMEDDLKALRTSISVENSEWGTRGLLQ